LKIKSEAMTNNYLILSVTVLVMLISPTTANPAALALSTTGPGIIPPGLIPPINDSAISPIIPYLPNLGTVPITVPISLYTISQVKSGLVASDSLTNETETQQQLQTSQGYWKYGGDAPAENAPYAISRDTQGFHNGVQAPANGTWAGYYATTPNTPAELFHAVITTPVNSLPSNNNWYENGLYVQTFEPGPVNYVACTSLTGKGYIQWVVFAATGNVNQVTSETALFVDTSPNQPLTRDCTIITNGQNFLQVYLDGTLVVNRSDLNLQMPEPFNAYLEPQTSYAGQLLNGTFTDYYATANGNVQVTNNPLLAATVDIVDPTGKVLATAPVSSGAATLNIGHYDMPLDAYIKIYDSNGIQLVSTPKPINIFGGDVYSVSTLPLGL
jgi:hypothetical protein